MNNIEKLIKKTELLRDIKNVEAGDRIFYKTTMGYQEVTMLKAWFNHIKDRDLVKFDYRILKKAKDVTFFNVTHNNTTYYKLTRDNLIKELSRHLGLDDKVYLIDSIYEWKNKRGVKKVLSDWLHDCVNFEWFDEPIYLREKHLKITKWDTVKKSETPDFVFAMNINANSYSNFDKEGCKRILTEKLGNDLNKFDWRSENTDAKVNLESWFDSRKIMSNISLDGKNMTISLSKKVRGITKTVRDKVKTTTTTTKKKVLKPKIKVSKNYEEKKMNLRNISILPPVKNVQCQGVCDRRLIGVKEGKGIIWCFGCSRIAEELDEEIVEQIKNSK